MKLEIEGDAFTFDLDAEKEGVKISALLQLTGSSWFYVRNDSSHVWLAMGRTNWFEVLIRALKQLDKDWKAEMKARNL